MLKFLRPYIEQQFKGIQIYLACKDESFYLLADEPRVVKKSFFDKNDYCYVRNIVINMEKMIHPVHELFIESDIKIPKFEITSGINSNHAIIMTKGITPTKSLSNTEVEKIKKFCDLKGWTYDIDNFTSQNCHIISVENEFFAKNILSGKKCILIDSGLGTNFYKSIFMNLEVIYM